ncbi:MAG: alkaline phosphatase family protein [Acidimicrobiales bacterium]
MNDTYLLPDYAGACVSNVVPALLEHPSPPLWMPAPVHDADQVVLLVLDGLGWEQLEERRALAPALCGLQGGPISTVAPSTTAAALTSIVTGTPPGEHGVVGYRLANESDVLNVLRWTTSRGDARKAIPPRSVQAIPAFCGHRPPVVTKAEFEHSGFSEAHLAPVRFRGYRMTSTLVLEVAHLLRDGEPFIYAYYEGIDKVAHEYGLREHYDAELASADRLVCDLLETLPRGAALLVTSDHGQVDTGDNVVAPAAEVLAQTAWQSGEGRFRWLHARPGRAGALAEAAHEHHGGQAWVRTRDEIEKEGWFGPRLSPAAAARLGEVALVAKGAYTFDDPADTGPYRLIGRHGSVTSAEMLVPLLAARA